MEQRRHLKQIAAFHDPTRFKFILAGRRGGKTTLIKEDILKTAATMKPGTDIFYVGPTNQQAMELIWDPLEERMFKMKWKVRPLISKQRFELPQKRNIYIIGAEKIRRIRGHKVSKAFLDEIAFMDKSLVDIWRAVRPALSDVGGGAVLATTPNGKSTPAYDFYLEVLKKENWAYHHWYSLDNPAILDSEIEEAKAELDEKSFRQEYEASWESYEGLAYFNFAENIHLKKQPKVNTELPLILHFDFNVNPTTLVLGQRYPDMYRFKKEYSLKNSSTINTVKNFCEDYKDQADKLLIKIRGDSSGRNRSSTTGFADYHYIQEMLQAYGFKYQYEVPASNPAIVDRVQHVNSYLMNALGQHRLEFDPSCVDTIRDLSSQELEGRFPSDKNNLGHKADAIGYGVYWDWINTRNSVSRTIQL